MLTAGEEKVANFADEFLFSSATGRISWRGVFFWACFNKYREAHRHKLNFFLGESY